jgi:hypothetical protein
LSVSSYRGYLMGTGRGIAPGACLIQ